MVYIEKNVNYTIKKRYEVPGGEIVLSKTEGIVISITGLLDGKPFTASWQAESISSILLWQKAWIEVKVLA